MSDQEAETLWHRHVSESASGENFDVRGWYHELYKPILAGKRVMDVGSGLGGDAITFAQAGAHVTCADIVQSNLDFIQKVSRAKGIANIDFVLIEDMTSLQKVPQGFDVIWCQGSMINAPFDAMREECEILQSLLVDGGRWIELAYPKERWEREGALPFEDWGRRTDGENTPWVEWYDLEKLLARLAPTEYEVILSFNFHNSDFNWFDLKKKPLS